MRRLTVFIASSVFAFLVGCSGFDTTQVLVHPDEIEGSSTFDVALVNVYTLPDTAVTFTNNVLRDSLHVLVGLPADWSVVSASMSVVKTMTFRELMALQANNVSEAELALQLIEVQKNAVQIPADALLTEQIKNRKIMAHDQTGDAPSHEASFASADLWHGFSAPVNLTFEKGTAPDTVMPVDSAAKIAATLGMIDTSSAKVIYGTQKTWPIPDTIGLSMIPVMVFLKVKAPAMVTSDTLYYFTKSGKIATATSPFVSLIGIKDTALSKKVASLEFGEMCYVPVRATQSSGLGRSAGLAESRLSPQVMQFADGSVRIHSNVASEMVGKAQIFTVTGLLIAEVDGSKDAVYQWNGNDNHQNRVAAGTYICTIPNGRSGRFYVPVIMTK